MTTMKLKPDFMVAAAITLQITALLFIITGFAAVLTLHSEKSGFGNLFFLIGCCWQADNGALFVGSAFGKFTPRFLPTVSPNKSYAGVIGALMFSTMSAYGYVALNNVAALDGENTFSSTLGKIVSAVVPPLPLTDTTTAALVGLALGVTSILVGVG